MAICDITISLFYEFHYTITKTHCTGFLSLRKILRVGEPLLFISNICNLYVKCRARGYNTVLSVPIPGCKVIKPIGYVNMAGDRGETHGGLLF